MDIFEDVPKYKKKSKKKGLSRSKHKHEYINCVFWQHERILDDVKGFIFGPEIKYSIGAYCPICGKIGTTYDSSWTVNNKDYSVCFMTVFKTEWNDAAKREFDEKTRTLPCFQLNDGEFFQKFVNDFIEVT